MGVDYIINMKLLSRIYGCLAGLAVGDSLGAPTEFLTPRQIKNEYGWVNDFNRAPSWHPHRILRAGEITDDTGQTLAVAHAYSGDGELIAEDVAHHLLLWAEMDADKLSAVLGPSTRQALERLRQGESPRVTGRKGTTNGAAYRALVVGLVNFDRPEKLINQVIEACLPTHGTTVAISGAAAVGFAVAEAMRNGATVDDIVAAACRGAELGSRHGAWHWSTPLEKRIQLAIKIVDGSHAPEQALEDLYNTVGVDMLVAESVATAIGLVKLAKGDPMQAVRYGANIGGDTDTIAAIAGAICGAYRGIESIDGIMLTEVEKVNRLDLASEAARLEKMINNRKKSDGE